MMTFCGDIKLKISITVIHKMWIHLSVMIMQRKTVSKSLPH